MSTVAGDISGFLDGLGTAALFNSPLSLSVSSLGSIFVADTSSNKIRRITSAGGFNLLEV